jgi:hypothetical protein
MTGWEQLAGRHSLRQELDLDVGALHWEKFIHI